MSETETVSLNLDGTFAGVASQDVAAADALSAALAKLDEAGQRVRDPKVFEANRANAITSELNAQASLTARIAAFDPARTRAMSEQEKLLRKMREDATGVTAATEKAAAAKARGEAGQQQDRYLDAGASALATAGAVVLAGAAAIGAAAWKLEQAGIATTDKHDEQGAIGGILGADYERSVYLSLKAGIDPDATWQQTKKLLVAKFSQEEIPALIRIKTGMDAAGYNGEGFLASLEKIKLEPKVGSRDVDRLFKLGLDSKEVYAELARTMGTDVAGATAKVKSGTADSAQVIAAIEKVAGGGKFGAIADEQAKSVTAAIAHIKGDVAELFDFGASATDSIKDVLGNVVGVIEGGEGVEVRASMKGLFDELNHAFLDGFKGEEGKERIRDFAAGVTGALRTITDAVHSVSVSADELSAFWKKIDWTGAPSWARPDSSMKPPPEPSAPPSPATDVYTQTNGGKLEAVRVGTDVSKGVAEGIAAGKSEAVNAAGQVVDDAIGEAKRRGKIHSPSEAGADEVGEPIAEGVALGMRRNPSPAAAGRQMAADALAGARSSSAQGASDGAAGSTSSTVHEGDVYLEIHTGGSDTAAKQWQALLPDVERAIRRIRRDNFEGTRP